MFVSLKLHQTQPRLKNEYTHKSTPGVWRKACASRKTAATSELQSLLEHRRRIVGN